MKRNLLFTFLLVGAVILFITGCGGGSSTQPNDNDKELINALIDKAATGVQNKDLAQFLECLTDPVDINGSSQTHQFITDTMWPTMPDFILYQFVNRTITVNGSTATVACHVRQQIDGGSIEGTPAAMALSKSGGSWKITSLQIDGQ